MALFYRANLVPGCRTERHRATGTDRLPRSGPAEALQPGTGGQKMCVFLRRNSASAFRNFHEKPNAKPTFFTSPGEVKKPRNFGPQLWPKPGRKMCRNRVEKCVGNGSKNVSKTGFAEAGKEVLPVPGKGCCGQPEKGSPATLELRSTKATDVWALGGSRGSPRRSQTPAPT